MSSLAKERKFKIRAKDFEVRAMTTSRGVAWCVAVVSLALAAGCWLLGDDRVWVTMARRRARRRARWCAMASARVFARARARFVD